MTETKFDIEKFDGKNDFALWQVRMKALLEEHGLAAALKELPAATIAAYDNVIQKKAYSALILCLDDREDDRSKRVMVVKGLYVRVCGDEEVSDLSEEHLKKDCPRYNHKKSQEILDYDLDSQGGSYHITYMRDYFVDFEEYEGGKILLGDGRECVYRGQSGLSKERISKKRTKNEAKTTKPDTEWKSVEKTKSRQSPSVKKSTKVNPDKSKVKK
ncbi:hypothetical protein Tco_1402544 [Tanacetum coccineum]